jgi:hypothetical protein
MNGIFIHQGDPSPEFMDSLNKQTREYELRAARGECAWICPNCCMSFPNGMPDECGYGNTECTELNARDKREALAEKGGTK